FAATVESSSHENYKRAVIEAEDNATVLVMKKVAPVRLKKNAFALRAIELMREGGSKEDELKLLDTKRERKGIFEGDLEEGELEMGQSSGLIKEILTAEQVVQKLIAEFNTALERMNDIASAD